MRLDLFGKKTVLAWLAQTGTYIIFVSSVLLLISTFRGAEFGIALTEAIGLVLVACIIYLRPRPVTVLLALIISGTLVLLLEEANRQKAAATDFPLMATDLKMFVVSSSGVLASIGAPGWVYPAILTLVVAAIVWLGWSTFRMVKARGVTGMVRPAVSVTLKILIIAPVLFLLNGSIVGAVTAYVNDHFDELSIWEPDGLVDLSQRVGILGFLGYAHFIETGERENFLVYEPLDPPPPRATIRRSAEKYVNAEALHSGVLPNVILVQAESTFDPNDVLRLATPIENSLFYTNYGAEDPLVHLRGPMFVNIIGGGSWVSEFEIITGMDSRLFGVAGRFTHASLSQYARNTFPRYMQARGYTTAAFTNAEASFYNYGPGYLNYGYQHFFGGETVGFPSVDIPIMEAALKQPVDDADAPFFKHILLAENHAPHWCDSEFVDEYEEVAFVGEASEAMICALKEYARRAKLTERAIALARDYLEAEKARTGREYVLAIYGDHQPYSFTGGGGSEHNMGLNFSAVRTDVTKRKTVLEIFSSMPNPLTCCGDLPVPATMLPTLISSYVATTLSDLYLPENLYQFDRCGSDWIGELIGTSFYGRNNTGGGHTCATFEPLLAAYKSRGIIQEGAAVARPLAASASAAISPSVAKFLGTCLDESGNLQISVTASGTWIGEAPKFRVMLDETYLGEASVENALENSSRIINASEIEANSVQFHFAAPITSKPETLRLYFTNDRWAGPDLPGDTDLWIHSIMVADRQFLASDFDFEMSDTMRGEYRGEWFRFATNGLVYLDLPDTFCN